MRFSPRLLLAAALLVGLALLIAACDSGLTETASTADADLLDGRPTKEDVCHVGNELPEYDAACDSSVEECGDAGKIDLISVKAKAAEQHLANDSHCFGDLCDYEPYETGEGAKDDDDGDAVDNGCDNCPDDANRDQANNDGDGLGDACDDDDDNDGDTDAEEIACNSDPTDPTDSCSDVVCQDGNGTDVTQGELCGGVAHPFSASCQEACEGVGFTIVPQVCAPGSVYRVADGITTSSYYCAPM